MPVRTLLVDDHLLAIKAVASILSQDETFEIVGEASNAHEAFACCHSLLPDLVLMDLNMPIINGNEATRTIKQTYPRIKIVVVSVSDDISDRFTAIQSGAQGLLIKNMEPYD